MDAIEKTNTYEFMTPAEVARELRITVNTARDLIRRHMTFVQVSPRAIRVTRAALDAYLRRVRKSGSDVQTPTKEESRQAIRDQIASKH